MRAVTLATMLVAFGIAGCGAEPSDVAEDSAAAINAKRLRYQQVDITEGPANVDGWFPRGLTADGEVIGQAFDCNEDFSVCRQFVLKRRSNGQFTVLAEDFLVNDVNSRGDSGGCTTDPVNFEGQAGVVSANGRLELIPGPGPLLGEAFGTNRDGSIIVGGGCDPFVIESGAWMWTASTGVRCFHVQRKPGLLPVPYHAQMYEVSDDGRVVVGAYTFGLDSESLIWFDGEPFYLKDYLQANGVPEAFAGWVNTGFALSITRDGRTLVGYGAGPRAFQGFMVVLPELDRK